MVETRSRTKMILNAINNQDKKAKKVQKDAQQVIDANKKLREKVCAEGAKRVYRKGKEPECRFPKDIRSYNKRTPCGDNEIRRSIKKKDGTWSYNCGPRIYKTYDEKCNEENHYRRYSGKGTEGKCVKVVRLNRRQKRDPCNGPDKYRKYTHDEDGIIENVECITKKRNWTKCGTDQDGNRLIKYKGDCIKKSEKPESSLKRGRPKKSSAAAAASKQAAASKPKKTPEKQVAPGYNLRRATKARELYTA